jgi:hypothetical protein
MSGENKRFSLQLDVEPDVIALGGLASAFLSILEGTNEEIGEHYDGLHYLAENLFQVHERIEAAYYERDWDEQPKPAPRDKPKLSPLGTDPKTAERTYAAEQALKPVRKLLFDMEDSFTEAKAALDGLTTLTGAHFTGR